MEDIKELSYKKIDWLMDEFERLIGKEHSLYPFEFEKYQEYKEAVRDEIINRTIG